MISAKFKPWQLPRYAAKWASLWVRKMPLLVQFEVTMRCNARCSFCDYWKTPADAKKDELKSFADAAAYFDPLIVMFTGGEPTLRRDLEDIVAAVDRAVRTKFMGMITHGAMMTPERGKALWDAGMNQFNFSLDYLDGRHDEARGIRGLTDRIFRTIPKMQELGIDNIRFNTVIKDDNLDQILPIVHRAEELGCGVNFSVYTDAKNGNKEHLIREDELRQLDEVIAELLAYKRRRRGVITSSDHYLGQIPRWARGELNEPCEAGLRTIHISPTGHVKRCPDFPTDFHWSDFRKYEKIDCDACFYACRGEAQTPISLSRVRDVLA